MTNDHQQMRIFITGATGLLGRHIVASLTNSGAQIVATYQTKNKEKRKKVPGFETIEWVDCDVLDVLGLQKFMAGCTHVIHAAAMVSFDPGDRSRLHTINVEGTANVVNCALQTPGIKKFVHISSVASMSPSKPQPTEMDERQGFNPDSSTSDYARSKYLAEIEVARGVEEGLSAAMVNPSVILAPGGASESSASLLDYARKSIPFYPEGWLNYVDVRDVARVVVWLLHNGPVAGEKMVLSAGYLPYQAFLTAAATAFGARPPYIKAGFLLSALGWRCNSIFSFLTGKKPFLTRYTAKSASNKLIYKSVQLPIVWPDFRFHTLSQSLDWIHSNRI